MYKTPPKTVCKPINSKPALHQCHATHENDRSMPDKEMITMIAWAI